MLYGTFIEVLLVVLYTVGNFQSFTNETQTKIVAGLQIVSSIVFAGAVLGLIGWAIAAIGLRRARYAFILVGMIGIAALSALLAVGATAVLTIQQPI